MSDADGWEKIGQVCIDGGMLALGDRHYLPHALTQHSEVKGSWGCGFPVGIHEAGAFAVWTGLGDGGYDVLVRRSPRTGRVAEVRVVFMPVGQDMCEAPGCVCGYVEARDGRGVLLSSTPCHTCQGTGLS